MSDIQISGDVAIRKAPEAPTIDVELPPPSPPDPKTLPETPVSAWPDSSGEREDRAIRESVKELRQQREETGRNPWVTTDGYDQEAPIAKWDASSLPEAGEHESTDHQIRRASQSLREARMAALGRQFEQFPSITEERGRVAAEAAASMPPVKVVPVGDAGQPIQPLRDDQPITELDSFQNINEAKRAVSQYRDWEARQQVALLNDLVAREEQQQAQVQAVSDHQAAQVRSFIEQPSAPQPDALAQERAALQAERQATAQVRQWSEAERKLAENVQAWDRWANQFPEMRDNDAFDQMVRSNPERAQQFMNARQQRDAAELRFRELQQVRAAGEMQIAARAALSAQQQVSTWAKQQDDIFQRELASRHPNYPKGPGLTKLQTAAKEYMLNDMGLSQAEIDRQWKGGALRSAAAQIALADAVAWKLAREGVSPRVLASHRAAVPPVQVPGVSRPRGADAEADVAALQRELDNAPTQRQQLAIARKLTQAKRAAGQL